MSSSELAISVRGLGKSYSIDHQKRRRDPGARPWTGLRTLLRSSERETFWALRDVSFNVRQGEVVGIIGRNGAGKSTLLKILSQITDPTTGEIDLYGRVGSLLEVGTGFHPQLSGRENIYLNGGILGMRRREIDRQFDAIVEFAGTEKFLDTPVKRYSSGMYVRLAFAVAAHLNPEILIVDEVLAVGDAEFQKKCLGKMQDVSKSGRTVLFVSHNVASVLNICSRAILLAAGQVVADGDVTSVLDRYLSSGESDGVFHPDRGKRTGDQRATIEHFEVRPSTPQTGAPVEFVIHIQRPPTGTADLSADLAVAVLNDRYDKLLQLFSRHMGRRIVLPPGRSCIRVRIEGLPLVAGRYPINLWLGSGATAFDFIEDAYTLPVAPGTMHGDILVENRGYPIVVPSRWQHSTQPLDLPSAFAAVNHG